MRGIVLRRLKRIVIAVCDTLIIFLLFKNYLLKILLHHISIIIYLNCPPSYRVNIVK